VVRLADVGGHLQCPFSHCSDPDAPGGTPVMQQTQVVYLFCLGRTSVYLEEKYYSIIIVHQSML